MLGLKSNHISKRCLRRQGINSHDIDYVEYVGPGLTWGRVLNTCVIPMWSNDIECEYMFMTPLQNLARKELMIDVFRSSYDNALRWIPSYVTDDRLKLIGPREISIKF